MESSTDPEGNEDGGNQQTIKIKTAGVCGVRSVGGVCSNQHGKKKKAKNE